MIMETNEYEKLFKVWKRINSEVLDECDKFIKSQLVVLPNKAICLDSSNTNVKCAYIKDGKVYVDTEEMKGCSINELNAEELYNLSLAVDKTIKSEFEVE